MKGRIRAVLVLADASWAWNVGGLSQIDRLIFALDRAARPDGRSVIVAIYSTDASFPSVAPSPRAKSLAHVSISSDLQDFAAQMRASGSGLLVLGTRLVPSRQLFEGILENVETAPGTPILHVPAGETSAMAAAGSIELLVARLEAAQNHAQVDWNETDDGKLWFYITNPSLIPKAEQWLLRGTAKAQDGFISRAINRRISRALTRWLIRTPILPNQWSVLMLIFPIAGCWFLSRGDYVGLAFGALFFLLHSVLDGCDGEIARIKYLDTDWGGKLDGLCDRFTMVFIAVGAGFATWHRGGIWGVPPWIYPIEGVTAGVVLFVSETLLQRVPIEKGLEQRGGGADDPFQSYVRKNRPTMNAGDQLKLWVIDRSGLLLLGDGVTTVFSELTKRDVYLFGLLALLVCDRPNWVLQILAIAAALVAILAVREWASLFSGGRVTSKPTASRVEH